ncbi:MAG TPA: AMP-binding protein, partial [Acidimicrobiales bacterium]
MSDGEWALAAVHDVVAEAVPDREMLVCGDVRRTFAEVRDRSRGLASFLLGHGIGLRQERSELERWESGQDAVALILHNGTEYIEAQLGAYRARAVPFNVNQHYRATELGVLLTDVGARAAVYHRRYGPLLAEAVDTSDLVLIDVDDDSGVDPLPGSTAYETAVA